MRTRRSTVRSGLRDLAQSRVDPPSSGFVDQLEQQLRTSAATASAPDSSNVVTFRKRISRGAAIGILAGAMSAAGAAAVAIVTVRHDDTPAIVTTTTTTTTATTTATTTEQPTGSTDAVHPAPISSPTTTTSSEPSSSAAPDAVAPQVTIPPSTEAAPTEAAPTPTPATPTATTPTPTPTAATEVHVAASLQLTCVPSSATIGCTWSAVPAGTDHVVVLRSTPGEARGRVLFPEAGANSITDGGVATGVTYTYLVHAMDASNQSLAHSNAVTVACCG